MKRPFKSFMNTDKEQHAFVLGWAETACPWSSRHRLIKGVAEYGVWVEFHYYLFGRVIGFITLGLEIAGFLKLLELIF